MIVSRVASGNAWTTSTHIEFSRSAVSTFGFVHGTAMSVSQAAHNSALNVEIKDEATSDSEATRGLQMDFRGAGISNV